MSTAVGAAPQVTGPHSSLPREEEIAGRETFPWSARSAEEPCILGMTQLPSPRPQQDRTV